MNLSEYKFEDIPIGLEVIYVRSVPGKVTKKYILHEKDDQQIYGWLQITWSNGNISENEMWAFKKISVKTI